MNAGPYAKATVAEFLGVREADVTRLIDEDGLIPQLAAWALTADLRDEVARLLEERGVTTD